MLKRAVRLLGFAAAVAIALGGIPGSAQASNFGDRYLEYGHCCNGEGLYGTKASIYTPAIPGALSFPTLDCIAARSAAESGGTSLIQAGWVRCAPGISVGGTCSLNNDLVQFVETLNPGDIYRCYPKGPIGYDVESLYSVRYEWFDTWYAWIDGVQDTHPVSMGGAEFLIEGMEWTGWCDDFRAQGDYAVAVPWHRFQASYTWYRVQSSSRDLGCGWSDWGGPPYDFSFFH